MIVETSSNEFFSVRDAESPELSHVWVGHKVKRVKGAFVPVAKAREILVRKVGSRVVEG